MASPHDDPARDARERLAAAAGVDLGFVERLVGEGAIPPGDGATSYTPTDVRRVRLLHAWHDAGLPVEGIMAQVRSGSLSIGWLDTPVVGRAQRLERTVEELAAELGEDPAKLASLYESIGFVPPAPDERIRDGDRELLELLRRFRSAGTEERAFLRLLRVYADSLRRVAKAEVELYESQIEEPMRRAGRDEGELLEHGARVGEELIPPLEAALLDVYHRHRDHVWIEHSIAHAEIALERAGLFEKVSTPPAICFVDLTGYTRLTEERGDEVAAGMAAALATLVEDISLRRGGRSIRWLGDGGMFHFKEPRSAVLAGLDMVESAPTAGLPPMHIGIHAGPVIFQDGDVYGRTVNLASRIASHAEGGRVLASEETVRRSAGPGLRFEPAGAAALKGVAAPVTLFRAVRDGTADA
ncbi:MAG TPA: adenylate/guanylate cyclase domain-containing protein [Actinomycetota bacterium]|nr:adenylate/guanylate cyclase domain-containing protein [Actinomycetota bacterium]